MCEPMTIALVVVAVAAVASAGIAGYSAYQQGKVAKGAAAYQEGVAKNNEIIANRAGDDALKRGAVEEAKYRQDIDLLKGKQIAGFAASGTDIQSDSALDIIGETAAMGELDALTIRSNYEREAYKNRVEGMNFSAQNLLLNYQRQSINPGTNAALTSTSSLLGSAQQFGAAFAGGKGGGGGGESTGATTTPSG